MLYPAMSVGMLKVKVIVFKKAYTCPLLSGSAATSAVMNGIGLPKFPRRTGEIAVLGAHAAGTFRIFPEAFRVVVVLPIVGDPPDTFTAVIRSWEPLFNQRAV
jgi:hypothetical protein